MRSTHEGATPLLLAHTYPGSSVDYLDVIDRLVDPVAHGGRAEDAFDVVIPDAPGFGFSQPLASPGWTVGKVAEAYDRLVRGLGYDSYGIHGSDNGAMVARELGLLEPAGFLGLHVLQLFSFPSGDPAEFEKLEPADYAGLEHMQWFQSVGGYNTMNSSRPQTVSVGISDSPVGLLAYSELFNSFGNGTSLVPLEKILLEVSVNWFRERGIRHEPQLSGERQGRRRGRRRRGCRAADQRRTHGGRRVRGRLPDDPGLRRARQREHRALEPLR